MSKQTETKASTENWQIRNSSLVEEYRLLTDAEDAIAMQAETLSCLYDDDVFTEAVSSVLQLIRFKKSANAGKRLSMLKEALSA